MKPERLGEIPDVLRAQLRIGQDYVEAWMRRYFVSWRQLRFDEARVRGVGGQVMEVRLADIEELIAIEDPVVWAWMNLAERRTLHVDGVEAVTAGRPWSLFPIQAALARVHGDLIIECGSEVGKTRDIVLRALWRSDTIPNSSRMIGGDSDQTLIPIWEEIEAQLEQNPTIGGGVVEEKCHIKPNRKKVFQNGAELELRLAGFDGKNFRGGHFSDEILGDEVAKWKNPLQWSEFMRAAMPGASVRPYSTPDGDYSSPFYEKCARAVPINGSKSSSEPLVPSAEGERRFRKFQISKRQLPYPFWSDARAAALREFYGGEHTVGWLTNVEGAWGSPSYSVFPMPTMAPCLRSLERYAMVTARIDKRERKVLISASRLDPALDLDEDSATSERMLAREHVLLPDGFRESGRELGRRIAGFFPGLQGVTTPVLHVGADLGSAQDPSEIIFQQVVGKRWIDLFRVHLRGAEWNEQLEVFVELDHASGHCAFYTLDSGSAGSLLVSNLTQDPITCPECPTVIYFAERLEGRNFGQSCDEIDIETGEPLGNPDDRDPNGDPRPFRLSNKEFSTRILERKMAAGELEIAKDGGAGDQRLSGPQLLVNHTATGVNKRGERVFRAVDDHHVDARRMAALGIVSKVRHDGFVTPASGDLVTVGKRENYSDVIGSSIAGDFGREPLGLDWY
jgi:hypothetical protein